MFRSNDGANEYLFVYQGHVCAKRPRIGPQYIASQMTTTDATL